MMSKEEGIQELVPEMTSEEKDNAVQQTVGFPVTDQENLNLKEELLNHVAKSKAIFKSQQKDDPDLSVEEKLTIARNILGKSHCLFLSKFGQYVKEEHLKYFDKSKDDDYEVAYHISRLQRYFNNSTRQMDVKNRRYQALKIMIDKGEYFSECEMMKRNPLLYEYLVGQYMTEKQKKLRDNIDTTNITFVNLLMEKYDRDCLRKKQKLQEEEEENVMEERDSDEDSDDDHIPNQSHLDPKKNTQWGALSTLENTSEYESMSSRVNKNPHNISKQEKLLLKQEFISNMYQNFLDGKDTDFDYSAIDDNEAYDNIDLRTQDAEDKYFDSESPETLDKNLPSECTETTAKPLEMESEDELDNYMKSLKVK